MKYKIVRESYFNEYGVEQNIVFYVMKECKGLFGWRYWNYIRHEECGWGDCTSVKTQFKTQEEAQTFIDDILCKEVLRQNWVTKDISESTCK